MKWRWHLSGWHVLALVLLAVLVDFAFTGIHMIRQDEQGVVMRFGKVERRCPPGITFTLPRPFEQMYRVGTTVVYPMPVGFKEVERRQNIPPTEEEVQWLTGDINILEMKTVVNYLVKEPVNYILRVSSSLDGASRNFVVRKVAESVLTELLAQMTVDEALAAGKVVLQEEGRKRIQARIDEIQLGIQVVSVNIISNSAPPGVISAFNDVSSAKADRERLLSDADGYARDGLPKARAKANRILQEAEIYRTKLLNAAQGNVQRFAKLSQEVTLAPEISRERLWREVVERALVDTRLVVYPAGDGSKFKLIELEEAKD